MKFSCTFRRWFIENRNLKNGWFVIWGHSLVWEFNTPHRIDFCAGIYGKMSHNMAWLCVCIVIMGCFLWKKMKYDILIIAVVIAEHLEGN